MRKIFKINFSIEHNYDLRSGAFKVERKDISGDYIGTYVCKGNWRMNQMIGQKMLDKYTTKSIDWEKINFMYRFGHLSLSRDKLSILKDKYDIKQIRNKHHADVSIVSEKTYSKLIHMEYGYQNSNFSKNRFITVKLPEIKEVCTDDAYLYLYDMVSNLPDDVIVNVKNSYSSWNNSDEFNNSKLSDYFCQGSNDGMWKDNDIDDVVYVKTENENAWNEITDPHRVYVSDTYVNEVCSEDSIILDWEEYKNILKMLKATNDDKAVAMTLMANCKIAESKTALGLLFYHMGESMKGTKVWNQVAFKTLRKQFDHYMISGWNSAHTTNFSSLIKKLAQDNALTEQAMKHICELVFKRVLTEGCGFGHEECAFEMNLEDVRLTSEYKEKLKKEDKTLSQLVTEGDDLPF